MSEIVDRFTKGSCAEFAVALSEMIAGASVVLLMRNKKTLHAACRLPDGRVADVTGVHAPDFLKKIWKATHIEDYPDVRDVVISRELNYARTLLRIV